MKNARFSIGRRIGFGFGILILLTLVAFIYTNKTLNTSRQINDDINNVYNPSVAYLEELNLLTLRSRMYISNWVYVQSRPDNTEKVALRKLLSESYPKLKVNIDNISKTWEVTETQNIKLIFNQIDTLFGKYEEIMSQLNSFESYEDATITFLIRPMVEENGEVDMLAKRIFANLNSEIEKQQSNSAKVSGDMIKSFDILQLIVRGLGFTLVIGGIIVALFTIRSIVKPIQYVRDILLRMGRGVETEKIIVSSNDEIGDMTNALNILIDGAQRTIHFAKEIGSGNFDTEYEALSEEDSLGKSLLAMRNDLNELTSNLEQKVNERTLTIEEQRKKMEFLFEQQTDSIKYAKRLQDAILPPGNFVRKVLPDSFIFFKPKDIVSGDFYFVDKKGSKVYFAAVDCTGHGVPGAFMSLIGHNVLKHALHKYDAPSAGEILNELSRGIVATLHQGRKEGTTKDGMDLTLCAIDFDNMTLEFAGAFNPLYFVRNGELSETKVDKMSIGSFVADDENGYTNHTIKLQKGDTIYIVSDGYCDQFGGPKGKKFMASRFREMLLGMQHEPMENQKQIVYKTIEDWRGHEEQIDDILLIGVRV